MNNFKFEVFSLSQAKTLSQAGISLLTMQSRELESYYCYLCNKAPKNRTQRDEHLNTAEHRKRDKLDKQEIWKFEPPRAPPPFDLCTKHGHEDTSCIKAHSADEINEWNQRLKSLNHRLKIRIDTSHELLMKKYAQKQVAETGKSARNTLFGASVALQSDSLLYVSLGEFTDWTFDVICEDTKMSLVNVAIIKMESLPYFRFLSPDTGEKMENHNGVGVYMLNGEVFQDSTLRQYYEVKVQFLGSLSAKSYETEILFEFGNNIMLSEKLYVGCGLETEEIDYMARISYLLPRSYELWNIDNADIVWMSRSREERAATAPETQQVTQNLHIELTRHSYCQLMQQWLSAEEHARQKILSSFHLTTDKAKVRDSYAIDNGVRLTAPSESQLAILPADSALSEDVDIISLLLGNCETAFVSLRPHVVGQGGKIKVFEVELLNRMNCSVDFKATQNDIFLCLSKNLTKFLGRSDRTFGFEVQFNLSGAQFDQWRSAVRLLSETETSMDLIFPDLNCFYKQWFHASKDWWILPDTRLNAWKPGFSTMTLNIEQRKLVEHAVKPKSAKIRAVPPLVVFGPFGTGKTKTMACAVAQMLMGEGNWGYHDGLILICTHSHPTADLYLKLIEELCSGRLSRRKLKKVIIRLFPRIRRGTVESLPVHVQEYVPTEVDGLTPKILSAAEIQKARVVVCTLFGANRLVQLSREEHKLKISHVFVDEAAQSLEAETLMPLCLTSSETRVIVAGDHNQIRPKVYLDKQFAKELNMSYLERLYFHYDNLISKLDTTAQQAYCAPKLLFNKNYRSHRRIIEFVSSEFYGSEQSLEACAESPETNISPLSFVCVDDGIEVQSIDSTSWFNITEAEAVEDTVTNLCLNWPSEWGTVDIGVLVAYHDQIAKVRDCMYRSGINRVPRDTIRQISRNVGKVVSMQGKEFKALVISTVLTRNLLNNDCSHRNLNFLGDPRLINTAITRARYSVTVVGDPVALLSIGECKDMWHRYLGKCALTSSIFPKERTLKSIEDDVRHFRSDCDSVDRICGSMAGITLVRSLEPDRLVKQLMEKTDMEMLSRDVERVVSTTTDSIPNEYNVDVIQDIIDTSIEEEEAVLHIQTAYNIFATPYDRAKPVIHIRSRKFCMTAFNGDEVLLDVTDRTGGKVYGKVKKILKHLTRPEQQKFVCFADPYRPGQMVPIDPRIPKICTKTKKSKNGVQLIVHRVVPSSSKAEEAELIEINRANYFVNLYVVVYLKWDEGKWCPFGMIVDKIKLIDQKGNVGLLKEQHLKIIDINYRVDDYTWSLDCYREIEECSVAESAGNREDFRDLLCFTIDSPGSKDLDDALSVAVVQNEIGIYEVGIHIADVSACIEKGNALDEEAELRGLTLYPSNLGNAKPKHMLPDDLSTDKCSLLPKKERLSISVLVQIRLPDAQIIGCKFTRSKILSSYQFTYEKVERVLANENFSTITASRISNVDNRLIILYTLASKLRILRLGHTRALSQDVEYLMFPRAELLVSEWMIQANHLVAKYIWEKFGDLAVVRKQLSPAEHLLREWKQKYSDVLPFSLKYSDYFNSMETPTYFIVPKFHWDNILKSESASKVQILLGFEKLNPLLVPADVELRSFQERSVYAPVAESLTTWGHHHLNLSIYTHFTSPIRRYIDIVVHRMLIASIEGKECPYNLDELKRICDHCTEMTQNGKYYETECFMLKLAMTDQITPETVYAVIYSINDLDVKMEMPTLEKSVDSLKTLKYAHLYLARNPHVSQKGQRHRVQLTWQRELYSLEEQKASNYLSGYKRVLELPSDQHVIKIPDIFWRNLQDAIKEADLKKCDKSAEKVVEALDLANIAASKEKSVCPEPTSEAESKTEVVKKREVKFCTNWEESTMLKVQLGSQLKRGLFQPSVQLLYLTPKLTLCLEHIRNASGCFASKPSNVIQMYYKNILEYQRAWLPVISMESAHTMVSSRESVVLNDVNVQFWQESNTVKALFCLPTEFCWKRMIQLSIWADDDPEIHKQLETLARLDCFCIKTPVVNDEDKAFIWVGHFISVQVKKKVDKNNKMEQVVCNMISCGSAFPQHILSKKENFLSTLELFISPVQFREMQNIMFRLQDASLFVRNIALGKCPVSSSLSIEWFVNKVLTKDKTIRVIRVYARELEKMEFPLPFDRLSNSQQQQQSFDGTTGIDNSLKDISLHHLIRHTRNRFSRDLLEFDAEFERVRQDIAAGRKEELSSLDIPRKIKLYKDKIKAAERVELANCDIIFCTATTANLSRLHFLQADKKGKMNFTVKQVILDEASMSPEPESLIPLITTKCRNVVLVGDHKQLSPVVLCKEAKDFGMNSTLFSKYVSSAVMLQTQYRMHEKIAEFPSNYFYDGKLEVGLPVQKTGGNTVWPAWKQPIVFCHCEGVEEMRVVTTSDAAEMSASNELEVFHVLRIVNGLVTKHNVKAENIAVLTQYRAQVELVKERISTLNLDHLNNLKRNVLTVINSQGGEWDYVIFTTVRSMSFPEIDPIPSISWIQKHIGSVADDHQICVALTRAKKGMLITGNANLLNVNETWKELITEYKKKQCFIDNVANFMAS